MVKTSQAIEIINSAYNVAEKHLSNESLNIARTAKDNAESSVIANQFVRIPFIGDFSSGKSSLLNSYLGIKLLPVNITPETAVSYELYFSTEEKLEQYREDLLKSTAPLSEIKNLNVSPGDIVKVFINNEKVRTLNERGIILVDMPGIDSGIKAHNDAIMNYIQEGSHFVVVVDADQAVMRTSTISLIDELKKYGISSSVIISKIDKKPAEEIGQIKDSISEQARKYIGENTFVGMTSAADDNHSDIDILLNGLSVDSIVDAKQKSSVNAYVNELISQLKVQLQLLLSNRKDYSNQIREIQIQKEKAVKGIYERSKSAEPVEVSADDIVNNIVEALMNRSQYLATILYSNSSDQKVFEAEMMSIVRPALINSFKKEITEYNEYIGSSLKDFYVKVNDILQDSDNLLLNTTNELVGNLLGKEVLETFLKKGLDKLIIKVAKYKSIQGLLKLCSTILAPVVAIVVNIVPDLLKAIFGKSKEKKIEDIKIKLQTELFPKIVAELRPEILKMLEVQRSEILSNAEALVEEETKKFDEAIAEAQRMQEKSDQELNEKQDFLNVSIDELSKLILA